MRSMQCSRLSSPGLLFISSLFFSLAGCAIDEEEISNAALSAAASVEAPPAKILPATRPVPGEYIVVLRGAELTARGQRVAAVAAELMRSAGGELLHTYEIALNGFAAKMSESAAKQLLSDPRIETIEENGVFELQATQQNPPSWGLDRIDQALLPLNQQYNYPTTGAGTHVYVIDTGLRRAHVDFVGSIGNHFDAIMPGGLAEDCQGHGTHVSGTIGGSLHGVAKDAILHPVRVFACNASTTTATIINAVNWVTANRVMPAVANMSLGGAASTALDNAILGSINSGILYVVAAGNSAANACNFSPARIPQAFTVAASTIADAHASFSNFGPCVDVYAPGVQIVSAWFSSNTASMPLNGTSMAAPHVAGMFARNLQDGQAAIQFSSGLLTGVPAGTPNRLARIQP